MQILLNQQLHSIDKCAHFLNRYFRNIFLLQNNFEILKEHPWNTNFYIMTFLQMHIGKLMICTHTLPFLSMKYEPRNGTNAWTTSSATWGVIYINRRRPKILAFVTLKGIANSPNNTHHWRNYVEKNLFTKGNASFFKLWRIEVNF